MDMKLGDLKRVTREAPPLSVPNLQVAPGRVRAAYLRFVGAVSLILSSEFLHFSDTNGEPASGFDFVFSSI